MSTSDEDLHPANPVFQTLRYRKFLHIISAVYVKDCGRFRQLKKLSQNGTTNHPAKGLTFVNDIATMLYEGDIREVENGNSPLFCDT